MSRLLDASASQLVLVDYQQRLLPALDGAGAALANAQRLADAAALLGIPAWGVEENPARLGPMPEALRASCGEVMAKLTFDACAEGLADRLARNASRRDTVIAGCEAHVCLLQTALGLLDRQAPVWVVADACASRTSANHQAALRRLADAGAIVVTTEMVLFEWIRGAAHPRFAEVLRLIK